MNACYDQAKGWNKKNEQTQSGYVCLSRMAQPRSSRLLQHDVARAVLSARAAGHGIDIRPDAQISIKIF